MCVQGFKIILPKVNLAFRIIGAREGERIFHDSKVWKNPFFTSAFRVFSFNCLLRGLSPLTNYPCLSSYLSAPCVCVFLKPNTWLVLQFIACRIRLVWHCNRFLNHNELFHTRYIFSSTFLIHLLTLTHTHTHTHTHAHGRTDQTTSSLPIWRVAQLSCNKIDFRFGNKFSAFPVQNENKQLKTLSFDIELFFTNVLDQSADTLNSRSPWAKAENTHVGLLDLRFLSSAADFNTFGPNKAVYLLPFLPELFTSRSFWSFGQFVLSRNYFTNDIGACSCVHEWMNEWMCGWLVGCMCAGAGGV